jgi:putative Holliday junction resolvase
VKDCKRILDLCQARGIGRVVVGLPYELDGTETRSARLARQIGEAVAATGMTVHYQDERFSTVEAIDRLGQAGVYGERRKAAVDQIAAVVILEEWLKGRDPVG